MYEHVQPSYFKEVRDEYKKRRDAVVEELNKIPGTSSIRRTAPST